MSEKQLPPTALYTYEDREPILDEELALSQLLADDVVFANSRPFVENPWAPAEKRTIGAETIVLFVGCNDVFHWASADSEHLPMGELRRLYEMWRANRSWGVTKWCCLRRGMRPQPPVMKAMREDGAWDAELEALPPRSHADACWAGCCKKDTEPVL